MALNAQQNSQQRLSTAQAAARLGIKPATLYAYVSRGLITSERALDAAGSTFDPLDVESLARSRGRGSKGAGSKGAGWKGAVSSSAGSSSAAPGGTSRIGTPHAGTPHIGTPLMVLDAPFALLTDESLYYRGLPVARLAREYSFEQIANWLWSDSPAPSADPLHFQAGTESQRAVTAACRLLGPQARGIDYLIQALLSASSLDPIKRDVDQQSIAKLGGQLIAQLVRALPGGPAKEQDQAGVSSIAGSLWSKLTGRKATDDDARLINMVLVFLVDHDLAVSTFAARVAASARAHPYAALISGLAAADSSLHGSASVAAREMLHAVLSGQSPEQAISQQLSLGKGIPGFGHRIYRRQDPRATALLAALHGAPHYGPALKAAAALTVVVHSRTDHPVNIDLALAVLMLGSGMAEDAGQTIFAIARSAGWLAHIKDEYAQQALRLRPVGEYTGPAPQH